MKVLLHTGLPKTGSTAIQNALVANRGTLRAQGLIYPAFGGEENWVGQWQLAAFWFAHIDPDDERAVAKHFAEFGGSSFAEQVISSLRTTLETAQAQQCDVLLSSEFLGSRTSPPGLAALRDLVHAYTGDIRVLAYIRPPAELFSSSVQQNLKRDSGPLTRKFMDHPNRARRVVEAFGGENTTIRIFSRPLLAGGDVVADYWNWAAGASGRAITGLQPGEPANESLSAPACGILARLRLSPLTAEHFGRTYRQVSRLLKDFAVSRNDPRLRVPEQWLPRIASSVGAIWNDTLELASHPETEKAPFRLPDVAERPPVTEAEVLEWLLGCYDHEFAVAFESYCRARPESWSARAARAVRHAMQAV